MALIPCPHCGKEVSSYAKRCPKCNGELSPEEMDVRNMVICSECGSPYKNELSVCPSCGKPTAFQNAESVKRKKHRNVIIAAIVVAAIGVGLGLILKNNADRKEAAQQEMLNAQRVAEEKRIEEERIEEEEKRKNKRNEELLQWLQGNWEWSGTIDGYRNSCRLGVSDDYAVLATPRGVLDQGIITIDFDDNTIHFGSTYMNFDMDNGRLGNFSNGMYYRRMSGGSSSRSSYSGGGSSHSTTTFNTSSDVMAYISNRFRNSSGNTITIKYDGLYSNGNQITNAVRVVRFNGSRASLSATSPYTQGTLYFTVDASRGTITDGSGDVFYIQ